MTRRKIPHSRVPFLNADGTVNREWYQFFERLPNVGEVATTATGGSATALPAQPVGYHTETINGEQKLVAHYDP